MMEAVGDRLVHHSSSDMFKTAGIGRTRSHRASIDPVWLSCLGGRMGLAGSRRGRRRRRHINTMDQLHHGRRWSMPWFHRAGPWMWPDVALTPSLQLMSRHFSVIDLIYSYRGMHEILHQLVVYTMGFNDSWFAGFLPPRTLTSWTHDHMEPMVDPYEPFLFNIILGDYPMGKHDQRLYQYSTEVNQWLTNDWPLSTNVTTHDQPSNTKHCQPFSASIIHYHPLTINFLHHKPLSKCFLYVFKWFWFKLKKYFKHFLHHQPLSFRNVGANPVEAPRPFWSRPSMSFSTLVTRPAGGRS